MSKTVFNPIGELITMNPMPDNPLGIIRNGALVLENGKVKWVGLADDCLETGLDLSNQLTTPGLIDSHTHTIFAGDRADEFEMRLSGMTYQEIAASGGGILKTVNATRNADPSELAELTAARLNRMLKNGVTTVEIKSGYGLTLESEIKCLEVLKNLDTPVSVVPTLMAAHDIPPEYKNDPNGFVDVICQSILPKVAQLKLAVFCDVFIEQGYFSITQSRRILETARDLGFKLKVHAEEFSNMGGALLAGQLKATSADHLLHISHDGVQALKSGGTVATLLPGTAFYLGLPYAPARMILDEGATVALATDYNPGSCVIENLQWIMALGCLQMKMTPAEVLQAVTINAAKAVALGKDRGSLTVGKRADVVIWDVNRYQSLLYHAGVNFVSQVYVAGERVV